MNKLIETDDEYFRLSKNFLFKLGQAPFEAPTIFIKRMDLHRVITKYAHRSRRLIRVYQADDSRELYAVEVVIEKNYMAIGCKVFHEENAEKVKKWARSYKKAASKK